MTGPNLLTMGWRNLWRHKRRTLITLSSIAFAAALTVIMTGMQDRSWTDTINLAARLGGGHVTLQHPDYLDRPALSRTLAAASVYGRQAEQDPDVTRTVTRIAGQALLTTARESSGAGFLAFDPAREDATTLSLLEAIVAGQSFTTAQDRGIILGARLAEILQARLGSKVVYTLTDKRGEIVTGLGRVSGILKTGAPSIDRGLCLLPLDSLRAALGYGADEATQVAVFVRDQRDSAAVAQRLGGQLGAGVAALHWRQTQPDLSAFIAMKKGGAVFFEILMLVLCAAGIFNTLFVSVMERLREFGILMAIGCSPAQLFRLVMWESLLLAGLGLVGGALVVAAPYAYLSRVGIDVSAMTGQQSMDIAGVGMSSVMHIGIFPEHLLWIALAAVGATLLAGLYPAWRAGRVDPVEVIKLV